MLRPAAIGAACLAVAACGAARPPVTVHAADAPPERLSEWGVVFADGDFLDVNDRVVPYELNTPLFSDYALKLRTIWLPEGTQAVYRERAPLDFPVGTIISKTFHYEKASGFAPGAIRVARIERESRLDERGRLDLDTHVLIETRLLVRYETGWSALAYVWNAAQDEAFLEIAGDLKPVELVADDGNEAFVYVVPDRNQCAGCHATDHTSKALQLIGPKAWQLNRDYRYPGIVANQLAHWHELGIVDTLPAAAPRGANWFEPGAAGLEERSKAYLDVNCAHCHNRVGAADTSGLDLDIETPVARSYGVCKPPVAVGQGSGDRPYDIYPGRPDESIMVYRMRETDPAIAMPELGRGTVHTRGVALVARWIASLDGEC